jgi:hypothetical protein
MSIFICPRCDYANKSFAVFLKHLNRKKRCTLVVGREDIDPVEHGNQLSSDRYSKKQFVCCDCEKKYTSAASLRMHKIRKHNYDVLKKAKECKAEWDDAFDDVFEEAATTRSTEPNTFGQEDIGHLLEETVSPELLVILEADMSWDEKLAAVVDLVYNDESRPHNKTFKSGTGGKGILIYKNGDYNAPKDDNMALKVIKQRANTVMQNPLSYDGVKLDLFVEMLGKEKYEELIEYTYRLDLEDDIEFDTRTSEAINRAIHQLPC